MRVMRKGKRCDMTTTETKLDAKEVAKALAPVVNLLLAAKAIAIVEREAVDPVRLRVINEDVYYGRKMLRGGEYGPEYRVTDPKDFEMIEADSERYHDRLHEAYVDMGYADLPVGHCPALVAEHNVIKAEWVLIEAAEKFFPGVTNDRLLSGLNGKSGLDTRRDYLDLMIKMVVNAPGYKRPLKKRGA